MQSRLYRARLPNNPLLQFVALIVAAVLAVGAVFVGAILLSFFLGLAVIAGIILYIRLWWIGRRIRKQGSGSGGQRGEFVEVEYTVIDERAVADEKPTRSED